MCELFYCGFKSHLSFDEVETSECLLHSLNNLKLDKKYGKFIRKAFIGWCSLFVITESGDLLHFNYTGLSKNKKMNPIECLLPNSWNLKYLDCGPKETFLVLADNLLRKWNTMEFNKEAAPVDAINTYQPIKVKEISVGSSFVCVLFEDGTVKRLDEKGLPVTFSIEFDESQNDHYVSISCGHEHILFLTNKGKTLSYGGGSKGQLGLETLENVFDEPKIIEALDGIKVMQISSGGWHSLALSEFGDIYAWGWNESSQLGLKISKTNVIAVPTLIDAKDINFITISCGSRHSMAISEDGKLYVWGWNKWGQLGMNPDEVTFLEQPTLLELKKKVVSVHCKYWSSIIETYS